ncbi:MAG: nucleotidyltransferase family protein [Endomicrobiales bacterium]|jgi:predicted nucleotidyltransferase
MAKLDEIKSILTEHKVELQRKFKIRTIGIFGSMVRNEQRKGSDTDILVEFTEPVSLFEFMDTEHYIEKLIHNKVDLVSKKALKHYIGKHILNEVIYV